MRADQSLSVVERGVVYSHYTSREIAAEQCVAVHGLTYLMAGSLRVTEAYKSQVFGANSLLFSRKNFLAKFIKQPAEDGPFQAITILFDQALLSEYCPRYGAATEPANESRAAVVSLSPSPKLHGLYESLQPYFEQSLPADLAQQAPPEALQLVLQEYPALQSVLFDFGQPGKIDLEAFMRQSFRFNIAQKQLAYLTGRSLATFKRDFAQIFHTTPGRWLYETRLAEAYYLLQEEHRRPSDVYHEVGFESMAHFSTAFKRFFGRLPSSVHAASTAYPT